MSTNYKAVFVDKDGTLIPDIPYNVNTELITLEEGVAEGLQMLQSAGYIIVIVSNQSGLAQGYFTVEAFDKVKDKINALLAAQGIALQGFYYCPHCADGDCDCRKPAPGMLLQAARELGIDLDRSWMIGDILNDVEAGKRAGCRSILIDNGNETEWLLNDWRTPDLTAKDFKMAAQYITAENMRSRSFAEL
ncbi:MAG TPA: HAD family hydrolase [Chitinophagaceae bacterium]|nr:HAD family hydrolase [Chitinophagaceae bacterium]